MKAKNILMLLGSIALAQAAGLVGTIFTTSSIPGWYAFLDKPDLAPPNWIFGPVWTTLFVLMGIAFFLVWKRGFEKREAKIAGGLFVSQLILNTFWSIIFFGLRSPGWAFVEIVFLWLAIVATIVAFAKISRTAAWLLIPYIAWVSFAAYLNYAIWALN